LVSPI